MNGGAPTRFRVALLSVFRAAAADRARGHETAPAIRLDRRTGADETTIRDHLARDLENLLGSVSLEASVDLSRYPHVRRSIANFGIVDLGSRNLGERSAEALLRDVKAALVAHEPRLIAGSLRVTARPAPDADRTQRLAFTVTGDLAAEPANLPVAFVAEIDIGNARAGVRPIAAGAKP